MAMLASVKQQELQPGSRRLKSIVVELIFFFRLILRSTGSRGEFTEVADRGAPGHGVG